MKKLTDETIKEEADKTYPITEYADYTGINSNRRKQQN